MNSNCSISAAPLTVVHGLEIVDEGKNVTVSHRDLFQHCNLISNLSQMSSLVLFSQILIRLAKSHHVFSALHQPLVNDFGGIVPPCFNVYAFLDN
jgi:hypothetical protein